jgi:hypothetical protein
MADRKISDLTALTTPASGDYLPIVDISEAAAASKNKRITIEELMRGVPDGTAAAPGIAFETDPNTGIYSPGANQLAAATNGVGRLFINSTGLVGIGSSAPQENLHLKGAGATSLRLETGNGVSFVSLRQNQTGNYFEISPSAASAQSLVVNRPGGSEALRVDSSGRVGIGTTPTTDILEIYGNLRFAQVSNYLKFANDSITIKRNGANALEFNSYNGFLFNDTLNSTERARIDSSGRLLVGTSTASVTATQVLQGNSGAASGDAKLIFARGTTSPLDGYALGEISFSDSSHSSSVKIRAERDGGTWTSGTSQPTRLVFSTTSDSASSPTERLRITSTGQVRLAGAGITFNGDTAAANELDDYEEGTWTGAISGVAVDNQTYSTYTKIGNTVFIRAHISVDSNPGDTFEITGLPFTSGATNRTAVTLVVQDVSATPALAQVSGPTALMTNSSSAINCDMHGFTLAGNDRLNVFASYRV